jgi:hypothetical protein
MLFRFGRCGVDRDEQNGDRYEEEGRPAKFGHVLSFQLVRAASIREILDESESAREAHAWDEAQNERCAHRGTVGDTIQNPP